LGKKKIKTGLSTKVDKTGERRKGVPNQFQKFGSREAGLNRDGVDPSKKERSKNQLAKSGATPGRLHPIECQPGSAPNQSFWTDRKK